MRKLLKKAVALALVLSSVLTLYIPASAAGYEFPETGDTVDIGTVLRGNPNISGQVEIAEKGGRQYLGVPIKGGKFYVFGLTDYIEGKKNAQGNYIYAELDSGIGIPRGIALDSKGTFYVTGDSRNVFYYNINTGDSDQITAGSSGLTTVAVDENDNIYAAGSGGVYRIDGKTLRAEQIYSSADFTTVQGIACGGGKVYIQGPLVKAKGGGSEVRMLSDKGALLASYKTPNTPATYYLSYVDGVVFVGAGDNNADGLVALDTANNKLTRLDMGNQNAIKGFVTAPYQGKSYMCLAKDGTYEYDVATRKLSRKVSNTCNRNLRARNYVKNGSNLLLLSVGPSSVTTIKGPTGGTVALSGLLEGAGSTYSARSIVPGVAGTGVAVYVGAYLSSTVASYSPDTGIEHSAFSNGHAQTDNMIVYKGKVYAGVYSGGYLIEYDPATDKVRELIPGLIDGYDQLRIHGLAAGDNKIFFSTIPNAETLGGCIGWYDLGTDKWYCERNVVQDQATITLAYDEGKDILYGGTTIRGGTDITPTAQQAVLFAYDVNAKKLLASAKLNDLTGDKPRFISGITRDPNTGKFWGAVSQTVFSFAYENGKLNITKEWAAGSVPANPYPDGASKSWFPRPIVFDDYGRMYIGFNETKYGIMQFTLGSDGKIKNAVSVTDSTTRIYTIGADGNLYYHDSELQMLPISRATMVRQLVDDAQPDDWESVVLARQAYESLTAKEKEQFGKTYYNKLRALEGDEDAIAQLAVDAVMDAIATIGTVTEASGPEIEAAREAYDALTAEQKRDVLNAQTLFDAEKAYKKLTEQDAPTDGGNTDVGQTPDIQQPTQPEDLPDAAVVYVQNQIDAIGTVTAESGAAIRAARWAYDGLTPEQQAQVSNYQYLLAAEEAYKLVAPKDEPEVIDPAVISVQTQINAIGTVTAASEPVVRAARAAYDALTPEQQAKVANVQVLLDAEEALKAFASDTPAVEEEKDNTATVIIIVVAVLVLAAGGAAAAIILAKKKKKKASL